MESNGTGIPMANEFVMADPVIQESVEGGSTANGADTNGFVNPSMLSLADNHHQTLYTDPIMDFDPSTVSVPDTDYMVGDDVQDYAMSDEETEESKYLGLEPPVPRRSLRATGCCYDDRMKQHANPDFLAEGHPEAPERISAIMDEFKRCGMVYDGSNEELKAFSKDSPTQYMYRIPARFATKPEICLAHHPDQYQWVQDLERLDPRDLREMSLAMDAGRKSLYVGNMTTMAALLAAGGAIDTCRHVVEGNVKNAIALIRPPGHHAEATESMGFCIFNNVPVAALVCQQEYPDTCQKVLILDWDVHHGNGTQNMFYNNPDVLYISLHVYQDGMFYPGQPEDPEIPDGGIENVGGRHAQGTNINIAWHDQGVGDAEYMAAFQKIVMPVAMEYEPDLVIISAGFDAAAGDQLGGCFVTPACYAHMTYMLMSLAGGKVAVCLEGGYDFAALQRSAVAVAKTLMGEPPEKISVPPIHYKADQVLTRVMEVHAPYWACFRRYNVPKVEKHEPGTANIATIIRSYQYKQLSEKFGMRPVDIVRDNLYRTFEYQVMVTPNINRSKKIMLIIHDPPELIGYVEPLDSKVQAHNAWMSDGVLQYINWAVQNQIGVMDLNIPADILEPHRNTDYIPKATESDLTPMVRQVVEYIWDNCFELWHCEEIILMGVGDSYFGVKLLLTIRDVKSKVSAVLNFVSGALRPIRSETDDSLSSWYKNHSRVYVSSDHACWKSPELEKKIRKKRFGTLIKSEETGLTKMMKTHFEDSTEWLSEMLQDDQALPDIEITSR